MPIPDRWDKAKDDNDDEEEETVRWGVGDTN